MGEKKYLSGEIHYWENLPDNPDPASLPGEGFLPVFGSVEEARAAYPLSGVVEIEILDHANENGEEEE